MKKHAVLAFLLVAMLLFGGCKANKNNNGASSEEGSSGAGSSETNDLFPNSSEPQVSVPESSEGSSENSSSGDDVAANAQPIVVDGKTLPDFSVYDNTPVTWGPGHQMDSQNRPTACVQLQKKYEKDGGLFLRSAEEKKVYLTFDEGYENGYTAKILDVLKEKQCPAVFFVTMSYVKKNPNLIRRMIDEGHVVGNHSTTHPDKGMPSLTSEAMVKDITELHNYVVENFNYQMTLFRPPAGLFSERSLEIAKELGYTSVLWSFAYDDWHADKQPDPATSLSKVTSAVHPGAIPLLHAVSSTNTQILGQVIDSWRSDGYTLEKLQ